MSIKEFDIKDINLAEQGRWRIEWALKEMPVIRSLMDRFNNERPLDGVKLSGCLHITTETANLARLLQIGGADVVLTAVEGRRPARRTPFVLRGRTAGAAAPSPGPRGSRRSPARSFAADGRAPPCPEGSARPALDPVATWGSRGTSTNRRGARSSG